MTKEFQNSSGFLRTRMISDQSLISEVSNFNFSPNKNLAFSDVDLKIPERLMLGKRAERYFSEWIKQSSDFELLAENIQVIDQKQTLGEFDFIVRKLTDDQLIHIELVYKFYLYDPSIEGSEFEHWIGPNRGDRLDFKLDKLRNHQFPLLHSKPAQDKFVDLKIDTSNIEQQVLFFANLFVPTDHQHEFDKVNENALEGTWMNLSEWSQRANSNSLFAIPSKTDWFIRELFESDWLTKLEVKRKIDGMHDKKRSPLIYSKDSKGNQRRDFVVWW